ncbi:MAG: hypothetical protein WBA84_10005 [Carnobacterium sp.]|uniref:hypothetical protein n=1 Tax=Carnobacterium sp. TaxID=48221 RepID=UPI003C78E50D
MIKERLLLQLILQADKEVEMNKNYESKEGTTEYRIELALLDFEEYDKLKWIDKEYNRLIIK